MTKINMLEQRKTAHALAARRFMLLVLVMAALISTSMLVCATPGGPVITYVRNSTATALVTNRSTDLKGTITVLNMDVNQQDYKWKAYVGNITGGLTLDDANARSIYDWNLASITGEVYVTRASSVTWSGISCANQSVIDSEQSSLGISGIIPDSINNTFNATSHKSFLVGTINISANSCKSAATYINGAAQAVNASAYFQEVLLKDDASASLIYTGLISPDQTSYDGSSLFDFQMIVAENETASVPLNYYFYVELG